MDTASVKRRWVYLLTGSAGYFFVGILFSWSIIKVPLREAIGAGTQMLASVYTLSVCFFCIGNLLTGVFLKKLGVKRMLFIASALIMAGLVCCSFLKSESSWLLYPFYGVMTGCGIGLSYNSILSTVSAWFPDKKGTCSGVLMMCFGLSSIMWGKLASLLFDMEGVGWRAAYVFFGVSIAAVLMACAFILHAPGKSVSLPEKAKSKIAAEDVPARDFSGREVLRSPSFWLYYIYGIGAAAVGSTVLSFAMDVCVSLGAAAATAVSMVGIASVGNGLGRVLCGLSFDLLGRKRTIFIANCFTLLAPLLMLAAFGTDSLLLAALSLLFSGLSFGTCPTIGSVLMSSFYGMKYFPVNYSLSNSKMIFSSLGATAAGALLTRTGTYTAPYIMLTSLAAISFLLSFFIKKPK